MIRLLAWIWTVLSLVTAISFGWLYVTMYWNHRVCFDENGRCFLDGVVYHDTSFVYFWIALLSALAGLAGAIIASRRGRSVA